jgi:hypothetical protein
MNMGVLQGIALEVFRSARPGDCFIDGSKRRWPVKTWNGSGVVMKTPEGKKVTLSYMHCYNGFVDERTRPVDELNLPWAYLGKKNKPSTYEPRAPF